MESLEIYCQKAMERGMDGAKVIDPRSIVTAEWVRMKCQFGCPGYGGRLCCPPHTPDARGHPQGTRLLREGPFCPSTVKSREQGRRTSMKPLSVLRSRSSWTAITRPGAWGLVPAGSARNATLQATANTATRQDLPWRPAALTFLKRQGIMGFRSKWSGVMKKQEISMGSSWWNRRGSWRNRSRHWKKRYQD